MVQKKKLYLTLFLILIFLCIFSIGKVEFGAIGNIGDRTTWSNFPRNTNLYCLNRGWHFSKNIEYTLKVKITIDPANPETEKRVRITPSNWNPRDYIGGEYLGTQYSPNQQNYYRLAYIVSRSNNKASIGGYANQVAVWLLMGKTENDMPNTSNAYYSTGKNIFLQSSSYAGFVNNYNNASNKQKEFTLEKGENFGYSNGKVGPFNLYFVQGPSEGSIKYGEPSFTLINPHITINNTRSITVNSLRSGEDFYITIPENWSSAQSLTLKAEQESIITAECAIWHVEKPSGYGNGRVYITPFGTTEIECSECLGVHNKLEACPFCNEIDCNHWQISREWVGAYWNTDCRYAIKIENSKYYAYDVLTTSGGRYSLENKKVLLANNAKYQNLLEVDPKKSSDSDQFTFNLIPPLELTLNKINTAGAGLTGARFTVQAKQDNSSLYNGTIDINGPTTINISAQSQSDITVIIQEIGVPADHIGIANEIIIIYTYENNQWKIKSIGSGYTQSNGEYVNGKDKFSISGSNSKYNITIKNRPEVARFEFIKLDELTNAGIPGVLFNVKIQNIAGGPTNPRPPQNSPTDFDVYTNGDGKIIFENMEFVLNNDGTYKDIILTLTEKGVPTDNTGNNRLPRYRFLHGPITITLRYDTNTKRAIMLPPTYNNEDNITWNEVAGSLSLTAKNQPLIYLGGLVWLDVQHGTKPAEAPNGKIESDEEGIPNIPVFLFKTEDGKNYERVLEDTYSQKLMTETAENNGTIEYYNPNMANNKGTYSIKKGGYFFPNLPKLKSGNYVIMYSYEGVNYIATIDGTSQQASEEAVQYNISNNYNSIREAFNFRFKNMSPSIGCNTYLNLNDTSIITLDISQIKALEYDTYPHLSLYKSKLITTTDYDYSNHENGKHSLTKPEFKMFARTKQNYNNTNLGITFGLKTRYVDLSLLNDVYEAKVMVNGITTIYEYNDIVNAGGKIEIPEDIHEGKLSYEKGKYNLKLYKSDYESTRGEPLKIELTYAISLNNEGIVNKNENNIKANVYKISEYYDEKLTLQSAKDQDGNVLVINNQGTKTINGKTYKSATIEKGGNGAIASAIAEGARKVVYLTFEVYGEGKTIDLKEYDNIAEILVYGTDHGLIDKDSEPGSISKDKKVNGQYIMEDDTDRAQGIEIQVPTAEKERIRSISGNVWEDIKTINEKDNNGNIIYTHGDGIKNNGDKDLDGIIVELYEVKNGEEKRIELKQSGKNGAYSFDRIIPGIYKVRFTYKTEKYNGQNYKSAIVSEDHYNKESEHLNNWYYNENYNITGSNGSGNIINKAIDSGKERSNLMAKYAKVDKETYPNYKNVGDISTTGREESARTRNIIEKMEANTPKIFTAIDVKPGSFRDADGTTNVKWNGITDLKITGVSLGIEKRPETNITVQEHIKKLTLKGNDNIVLAQAEVDNEDILFTEEINLTGHLKGLIGEIQAIKTNREEPGHWEIATDIGEVLQGGSLEAETVYQVKNESEQDYLSTSAINDFNSKGVETYSNDLKNKDEKAGLAYIGKTYYTGKVDNTVAKVPTRIGTMQDYVGDLEFRSGEKLEKAGTTVKYNKAVEGPENIGTTINNVRYYTIAELFNGNKLLKDNETGEIITAIKDQAGYWKVATKELAEKQKVKEIIKTKDVVGTKLPGEREIYRSVQGINGLTPTGKLDFENYMAEIMEYAIPTGRVDERGVPGNLNDKFVYAEDKEVKLTASEQDEFAAERISIVPPTGEDKQSPVVLIIAIVAGIVIIAVGAYAIKKYVK